MIERLRSALDDVGWRWRSLRREHGPWIRAERRKVRSVALVSAELEAELGLDADGLKALILETARSAMRDHVAAEGGPADEPIEGLHYERLGQARFRTNEIAYAATAWVRRPPAWRRFIAARH